MKQPLKISLIVIFLLLLSVILVPIAVVGAYKQEDNSNHLALKKSYLRSLAALPTPMARPNVVLILLDDLGYGDIGVYGAQSINTPHIDSMAENGTRYTHYYSASPVCTTARAALLTGRYPPRAGLAQVVFPEGSWISDGQKLAGLNTRIPAEEIMIPEVLKAVGYRTGMVGKWHMGDLSPSLPNEFGFDFYYGARYSNDMTPFMLYRNEVIEEPAELDQTRLNELYTEEVVGFIEQQDSDTPFFLYYAHNFPHIPLYSSDGQAGKSDAGLYGDVVEDIDRSVGKLLAALERKGLSNDTLIIFTSDNGPWYQGNPGYSRGRKNQTWEGGQRVPFIVQWPGRVAAGAEDASLISGVDLMPTLLRLLALPLPDDRVVDGIDISTALLAISPLAERELFYFPQGGNVPDAVRDERFKYHRRRGVRGSGFTESIDVLVQKGPWLFDLAVDEQESYDVSTRYPDELVRLQAIYQARVDEMNTNPRGWLP
jgi:arylsulfatase A-like enzyme